MGFSQHKLTTTYTQELAAYIAALRYEDIPEPVLLRAKAIVIHTLGNALAARDLPQSRTIYALAEQCGGGQEGDAVSWADGSPLSLENACLLNTFLADLPVAPEDCSCTGHPAAGILSVAWGVAHSMGLSGKELLAAMVAGYEVYLRVAAAVRPTPEDVARRGKGMTSWQLFAAAVPALKLMGLQPLQINKGLSMVTTCVPIPASFHLTCGSDVFHAEHALRSQTAITLARCAKLGVENLEDGLDDFNAFGTLMTSAHDPAQYTRELGTRYLLAELPFSPGCGPCDELALSCQRFQAVALSALEQGEALLGILNMLECCENISALGQLFR